MAGALVTGISLVLYGLARGIAVTLRTTVSAAMWVRAAVALGWSDGWPTPEQEMPSIPGAVPKPPHHIRRVS